MRKLLMLTITASGALALGACAASPPMSSGERLTQRGNEIAGYGDDWTKGREDVAKGRKAASRSAKTLAGAEEDLARAQKNVAKAEQQIRDARLAEEGAQRQIVDGTQRMDRAEAEYAAIRAGPPAVPPAN
jgi:chromosome segregation ATPase